MANVGEGPTYLDKQFVTPQFIWNDGICDVEAVQRSVAHLPSRLAEIIPEGQLNVPKSLPASGALETHGRPDVTPANTAIVPLRSDVWNGIEPINYHAQITIGQDQKAFFVDLDTGSSLLWVQSLLQEADSAILDQNSYVPSKSNTAHDLKKAYQVSYGDGGHVNASLFTDQVIVGSLISTNQTVGAAATSDIKDSFRSKSSNGLLGLGFPLSDTAFTEDAGPLNVVLALHASGRIKYASLTIVGPRNDPKLAAQIDKKVIMQPRGFFIIGSVDPKFYTGNIAWCPQIITDRWIVILDEVVINETTLCRNQKALIDTGVPYVVASPNNYEKVISIIPGAKKRSADQGVNFVYPEGNLTKISFAFGGRQFDLFPQDFSLGGLRMISKRTINDPNGAAGEKQPPLKLASIVRLESWPFDDDLWIMGGIFLDNIVTIFDFGNHQVGLATINPDDPST